MSARRLALAALAAAFLACGVRAPPRPPEGSRRVMVEPTPAGTTSSTFTPTFATTTRAP
ncbi:MAG TPA: hypothetical protein VF875_08970 [Anaeromyxobacter sp.]